MVSAQNLHTQTEFERIVWHVGPQKTGTTSIQELLTRNASALSGFLDSVVHRGGTKDLARACEKWLLFGQRRHLKKLKGAITDLVASRARNSNAKTLIVSDEELLGRQIFGKDGHIGDRLCRLAPILSECSPVDQIDIVFYRRDSDAWLRSAYAQEVRQMGCAKDWDDWRAELGEPPKWDAVTASLADVSGVRSHVLNMKDEASVGRLGKGLLEVAGVPDNRIETLDWPGSTNERWPAGATQFMRFINAQKLSGPEVRMIRRTIDQNRSCFTEAPNV